MTLQSYIYPTDVYNLLIELGIVFPALAKNNCQCYHCLQIFCSAITFSQRVYPLAAIAFSNVMFVLQGGTLNESRKEKNERIAALANNIQQTDDDDVARDDESSEHDPLLGTARPRRSSRSISS